MKLNNNIQNKIKIIKDFANKMGYTTEEHEYINYKNNHKCYAIYLCGTEDGEGEPFSWAWDLKTNKEM